MCTGRVIGRFAPIGRQRGRIDLPYGRIVRKPYPHGNEVGGHVFDIGVHQILQRGEG